MYSRRRRPKEPLRPVNRSPPHPPLQSASEGVGGARGLGHLVRLESHPEPRGFPVRVIAPWRCWLYNKLRFTKTDTPAFHVVECRMAAELGRLRPWLSLASKEGLRTTADAGRVVALVPFSCGGCTGREA